MNEQIQEIRYLVGEAWKGTYDAATPYGNANVVQDPTGLSVYRSLKPGNVGHPLTDANWWFCIINLSSIKAESDRIAALNQTIAQDEALRVAAEQQRIANEQARETQYAADHSRAEADHETAAADHTQAEQDHTQAEEDHTQAGDDHTRAESDHNTAAADHTQATTDHTRAESDHTRAESDHAAVEVYVDSLGAFDISAYHATGGVLAKYADLTAALGTNGANIPDTIRKGGMSVKFVLSSDNKYVQYFCKSQSFTINVTAWEKVILEKDKSIPMPIFGVVKPNDDANIFTVEDYPVGTQLFYNFAITQIVNYNCYIELLDQNDQRLAIYGKTTIAATDSTYKGTFVIPSGFVRARLRGSVRAAMFEYLGEYVAINELQSKVSIIGTDLNNILGATRGLIAHNEYTIAFKDTDLNYGMWFAFCANKGDTIYWSSEEINSVIRIDGTNYTISPQERKTVLEHNINQIYVYSTTPGNIKLRVEEPISYFDEIEADLDDTVTVTNIGTRTSGLVSRTDGSIIQSSVSFYADIDIPAGYNYITFPYQGSAIAASCFLAGDVLGDEHTGNYRFAGDAFIPDAALGSMQTLPIRKGAVKFRLNYIVDNKAPEYGVPVFSKIVFSKTTKKEIEEKISFEKSFNTPKIQFNSSPITLLSSQDQDATQYDNAFLGFSKVIKVSDSMFYLYYLCWGKNDALVDGYNHVAFAYSTDGIHYQRGFPNGVVAPIPGTNLLFERNMHEMDVFIVNDKDYPFRMIANEMYTGTYARQMCIWKSADGVNFIDKKVIFANAEKFDTQFSCIVRGNHIKLFYRIWEGQLRKIGVILLDIDGNIISPCKYVLNTAPAYNSAASILDDKREILFPTYYDWTQDPNRMYINCYVLDGDKLQTIMTQFTSLFDSSEKWGTVAPGIVNIGGVPYLVFDARNFGHGETIDLNDAVGKIHMIELTVFS